MEILSWINAITTIILAGITFWYARITKQILNSSEKTSNEQLRPYVIAHLYSQDLSLKLSIHNIGKRPAVSVNIKFTPSLYEIDRLANKQPSNNHSQLLEQSIIPPDFKLTTILIRTPDYLKLTELPRQFNVEVTYKDLSNNDYSDSYEIDLSKYVYKGKTIEYTDNYYFAEINKQLKEINNSIKNRD